MHPKDASCKHYKINLCLEKKLPTKLEYWVIKLSLFSCFPFVKEVGCLSVCLYVCLHRKTNWYSSSLQFRFWKSFRLFWRSVSKPLSSKKKSPLEIASTNYNYLKLNWKVEFIPISLSLNCTKSLGT